MTDKPPVVKGKKIPLGYPRTPHPPTASQHHVPRKITGPQSSRSPSDPIPDSRRAVSMMLGKMAPPVQSPPPDYSKPFDPPKGARS